MGAITETSGAREVVTRGILDAAAKPVKSAVNGRARYTSNRSMKPRILVIPNASSWILGDIARQIIAAHADRFEFRYLSELTARARPDHLRRLAGEVDLVHALTEVIAARIWDVVDASTPVVTWIHHICEWRPEHQRAVERSAHIVASTEGWRDAILERAPSAPVTVVGYGVDTQRFRRQRIDRASFGLPDGAFVVGIIGSRFSDLDGNRKGLDTLRSVVHAVNPHIPSLHIVFVGPGWDDEVTQLRADGISASAVGFLPAARLPDVYSVLDAYLMTSRVEGGPCTILEAMACETPVIATRVGLVEDVLFGPFARFTAPAGDAPQLSKTLIELCALAPGERAQVGQQFRDRVVQSRQWNRTLQPLARVYDDAASSPEARVGTNGTGHDVGREIATVSAADALIGSTHAVLQAPAALGTSVRMFRSMTADLSSGDVLRGAALLGGALTARIRKSR